MSIIENRGPSLHSSILTIRELTLNVFSEMCPKCRRVNLFPGFSRILFYTCQGCGEAITLPDDADTGQE